MRQAFAWAFAKAFKAWSPHTFHRQARSPDPTTTACGVGHAGLMKLGFGLLADVRFASAVFNVEVKPQRVCVLLPLDGQLNFSPPPCEAQH